MSKHEEKLFWRLDHLVVARIARLTDQNCHGDALLALAELLDAKKSQQVLWSVLFLHREYGHLPKFLKVLRDGESDRLFALARERFSPEDFEVLHRAF